MLTSVESARCRTSCRICANRRCHRRRRRLHELREQVVDPRRVGWSASEVRGSAAVDRASRRRRRRATTSVPTPSTCISIRRARRSTGWGGRAMISKATGLWRPNVQVQAFSPGFETNDTGFMQRTDIISVARADAVRQSESDRSSSARRTSGSARGRTATSTATRWSAASSPTRSARFRITGSAATTLFLTRGAFSDRLTRGGPLARTPPAGAPISDLGSDDRKTVRFSVNAHADGSRRSTRTAAPRASIADGASAAEPAVERQPDVHPLARSHRST